MRSENYVYFQTNPFIKLYTLCMADIVMLYSSLCRSAGAMAGDSLGPGSALGKRQKTGYSKKKNGEQNESRDGQFASLTVFFAFSPHFFIVKSTGHEEIPGRRFPHLASPLASLLRIFLARKYPGHNNPASYAG